MRQGHSLVPAQQHAVRRRAGSGLSPSNLPNHLSPTRNRVGQLNANSRFGHQPQSSGSAFQNGSGWDLSREQLSDQQATETHRQWTGSPTPPRPTYAEVVQGTAIVDAYRAATPVARGFTLAGYTPSWYSRQDLPTSNGDYTSEMAMRSFFDERSYFHEDDTSSHPEGNFQEGPYERIPTHNGIVSERHTMHDYDSPWSAFHRRIDPDPAEPMAYRLQELQHLNANAFHANGAYNSTTSTVSGQNRTSQTQGFNHDTNRLTHDHQGPGLQGGDGRRGRRTRDTYQPRTPRTVQPRQGAPIGAGINRADVNPVARSNDSRSRPSASTPSTTSGSLLCPYCSAPFTGKHGKGNMARHIRHNHGSAPSYRCEAEQCDRLYARTDARRKHYREHHPELLTTSANRNVDRSANTSLDLLHIRGGQP